MKMTFVKCSLCGKQVSNVVYVEDQLIIRAWIECPECIEQDIKANEVIKKIMGDS